MSALFDLIPRPAWTGSTRVVDKRMNLSEQERPPTEFKRTPEQKAARKAQEQAKRAIARASKSQLGRGRSCNSSEAASVKGDAE